jgi:pentatricopeptide repeat protein
MAFQNLRNALIDMYAKCGDMADAQKLFSTASMSDQVSWNALIAGYARQEDSVLVFRFVQSMMESMVLPDDLTFLSILSACSHGGLLNEGQKCFKLIPNACGTAVTIGHYNCVLDLFGRSGQVDEATEIVKCLPLRPTLVTWSILLDAYRRAGDVGLSKKAFESAVQSSQDNNVSSFILMSNIYAAGCLDMEEDP